MAADGFNFNVVRIPEATEKDLEETKIPELNIGSSAYGAAGDDVSTSSSSRNRRNPRATSAATDAPAPRRNTEIAIRLKPEGPKRLASILGSGAALFARTPALATGTSTSLAPAFEGVGANSNILDLKRLGVDPAVQASQATSDRDSSHEASDPTRTTGSHAYSSSDASSSQCLCGNVTDVQEARRRRSRAVEHGLAEVLPVGWFFEEIEHNGLRLFYAGMIVIKDSTALNYLFSTRVEVAITTFSPRLEWGVDTHTDRRFQQPVMLETAWSTGSSTRDQQQARLQKTTIYPSCSRKFSFNIPDALFSDAHSSRTFMIQARVTIGQFVYDLGTTEICIDLLSAEATVMRQHYGRFTDAP